MSGRRGSGRRLRGAEEFGGVVIEQFPGKRFVSADADEDFGKGEGHREERPVRAEQQAAVVNAVADAFEVGGGLAVYLKIHVVVFVGVLDGLLEEVHAGVAEDELNVGKSAEGFFVGFHAGEELEESRSDAVESGVKEDGQAVAFPAAEHPDYERVVAGHEF